MAWAIKYSDTVLKELKKHDKGVAKEVLDYMDTKIAALGDPTTAGKGLTGTLATFWQYRVRDLRVICHVDKDEVTVLVLHVGHRKEVYGDKKRIAARAAEDVKAFQKTAKEDKEKAEQQAVKDKADKTD